MSSHKRAPAPAARRVRRFGQRDDRANKPATNAVTMAMVGALPLAKGPIEAGRFPLGFVSIMGSIIELRRDILASGLACCNTWLPRVLLQANCGFV